MKFIKYIFATLAAGFALGACSDIETVQATSEPTASVLAAYTLPIEITEDNMSDKLTFEWSAANFGYSAAVTYNLCGVMADGEPGVVATVNTTKAIITKKDFNRAMLGLGAKGNKINEVSLYVEASINDVVKGVKSNSIPVEVTPYRINFVPALYAPGSHQGWSPASAPQLALVDDEEGLYDGFLDFPTVNTEFKFTGQADWDPESWGTTLAKLEYKGGNIKEITAKGFYRMSVNLPKLKATPMLVTSIGLIGDATPAGWDSETQLVQDGYLWKGSFAMKNGEYKVRFNNSWDYLSLGGSADALSTSGGNIAFTGSGSYDVVLDLSKYPWTITFSNK